MCEFNNMDYPISIWNVQMTQYIKELKQKIEELKLDELNNKKEINDIEKRITRYKQQYKLYWI